MGADIRTVAQLMQRHDKNGWRQPSRRGPGWYAGPFLEFANRLHGDALPSYYNPAPHENYRNTWWAVMSPWFFVTAEEDPSNPDNTLHNATNIRVQTRNFRVYLRRAAWIPTPFIDQPAPDSNQFDWGWGSYMGVNDYRYESALNGGGTSHGVTVNGAASLLPHGYAGFNEVLNPWEITGVAIEMEHRLILDDPSGVDQRSTARLLMSLSGDQYPYPGAPLPNVGYWTAMGVCGWQPITSSWQTIGFTTHIQGARPGIYSDTLSTTDTLSLLLADPPPGWTDGGGGGVIIQPPAAATAKRVILLGDDFIRGDETTLGSRSIRGRVIADMATAGQPIDAVGRQQLVPAIGGDPDHEGWAGVYLTTTSDTLSTRVPVVTQVIGAVDAVVLMAGLADYVNAPLGIADRFEALLNTVRSSQPAADIIICTLPPRQGLTEAQTNAAFSGYADLNARIRTLAASNYGVTLADCATASLVVADYHGDELLLQSGADKVGAIVAAALRTALGVATSYLMPRMPRRGYVFPREISSLGIVGPMGDDFQAPGIGLTSPELTSPAAPTGAVNVRMSWRMAVTGSPTPTVSVTSGTLPAGLSLSGLEVSGTPTTAGTSTVTFTATNGVTPAATLTATFTITARAAVTTTTLLNGVVGVPYYQALGGTGTGTLVWSITGTLPACLSTSGNAISGTPSATGSASLSAVVSDDNGPSAAQSLTFTVAAANTPQPTVPIDGQWQRLPRDVEVWIRIPRDT